MGPYTTVRDAQKNIYETKTRIYQQNIPIPYHEIRTWGLPMEIETMFGA